MNKLTVDLFGNWRLYWPSRVFPWGSVIAGTIDRGNGCVGALFKMPTGTYMQGNAGTLRNLPQRAVRDAYVTAVHKDDK